MEDLITKLTTPMVEFNFGGLDAEFTRLETAHAVLLPVPYDGTTSYRPGTRFGPQALLAASRNMELYDEQLGAHDRDHRGEHRCGEEPTQRYTHLSFLSVPHLRLGDAAPFLTV